MSTINIGSPIAVATLVFDGDDVVLVEQNRGIIGNTLEIPSGKMNDKELPHETAMRELEEETGLVVNKVDHLISYYPSVGHSNEIIDCYLAERIIERKSQRLDSGERINVRRIPQWRVMELIQNGEIKDSKTIMAMYAYAMRES